MRWSLVGAVAMAVALVWTLIDRSAQAPVADSAFAAAVPVYPEARLQRTSEGLYADALFGPPSHRVVFRSFRVDGPSAAVVSYYADRLPLARRHSHGTQTTFAFSPAGASAGESVTVTVLDGELRITELVNSRPR